MGRSNRTEATTGFSHQDQNDFNESLQQLSQGNLAYLPQAARLRAKKLRHDIAVATVNYDLRSRPSSKKPTQPHHETISMASYQGPLITKPNTFRMLTKQVIELINKRPGAMHKLKGAVRASCQYRHKVRTCIKLMAIAFMQANLKIHRDRAYEIICSSIALSSNGYGPSLERYLQSKDMRQQVTQDLATIAEAVEEAKFSQGLPFALPCVFDKVDSLIVKHLERRGAISSSISNQVTQTVARDERESKRAAKARAQALRVQRTTNPSTTVLSTR